MFDNWMFALRGLSRWRRSAGWSRLAAAALIALAGLTSANALAVTCSSGPAPGSLSFALPAGSYSVPRDTPVGTRITPWTGFSRTYAHVWSCTPPAGNVIYSGPAYLATLTPAGQTYSEDGQSFTVFQTNLAGVGLVIGAASQLQSWSDGTTGADVWADIEFSLPIGIPLDNVNWAGSGASTSGGASPAPTLWFGASLTFAFVKTGPVTGGTISMPAVIGTVGMSDRPIAGPILNANLVVSGNPSFQEIACTTPSVTVNLGSHANTEFNGVGSTTSTTAFTINLNSCPSGINNVHYEIDAVTSVVDTANSVVALDSGSKARGVGVQLLDGSGTPVPLGNPIAFTSYNPAGGNFSIPFKARYYEIPGSPVLAGSANTVMTFTMNYQ
ncbi:fimbrial protein [Paraburkholderia phymatum]|uniref:Fimbrial protein n=1 Tax=Paraburkholderia phymatum TaxID=148447 RepID=A0ACC6U309_9BURK